MKLLPLVICVAACGPTSHGAPVDGTAVADAAAPDVASGLDAEVASGPVHVVITADNAYSFGYGDAGSITHFTQGTRAQTAGEIFNCPIGEGPEVYDVPAADAPDGSYLYIVAWDDLLVTQGVLAQFSRDTGTVLTGDMRFEVCATGLDYSTGPDALVGPDLVTINTEIARCDAGTGAPATTSAGWVNLSGASSTPGAIGTLAVGEANDDSAGTFPIVCQPSMGMDGIVAEARWMWYLPGDGTTDAFHSTGVNTFKAFLIFRLGASQIIE
jgi:hypothetical protein